MLITELLTALFQGQALSQSQSQSFFSLMAQGQVTDAQLAAAVTVMKMRGESIEEISGAAHALRQAARPFPRPEGEILDIVGTGGDGANTINISTTACFVAAAAGVRVAKHGSRAVSSRSGASDLLAQAGVNLTLSPEHASRCLQQLGMTFLFAPHYHSGMKHAANVRQQLKTRSIFNLLGPLLNPARPTQMLLGIYDPQWLFPIAEVVRSLGVQRALIVHGSGLDELAVHGDSQVVELRDGQLTEYWVSPEQLGVKRYPLAALVGGDAMENLAISRALLQGKGSPAQRAAVAINAGAGLYLAGKATTLAQGTALALATLDSGSADHLLKRFVEASQ